MTFNVSDNQYGRSHFCDSWASCFLLQCEFHGHMHHETQYICKTSSRRQRMDSLLQTSLFMPRVTAVLYN